MSLVAAAVMATLSSCSTATSAPAAPVAVSAAKPIESTNSQSYIVEATSTDVAAQAVHAAGGQVVSRLGVIDAVEAKLTDSQHARVKGTPGIKQITVNAVVMTQAAASVRDNFETDSFANNDGTHRWWGDWTEVNDNNSPYGGKISVGWLRARRQAPDPRRRRRHLASRGHALERQPGHAEAELRARLPRGGRIRIGAGQRQWRQHLDRSRPHQRRGQRPRLHHQELQHHRVPRPKHRDPLRRFDATTRSRTTSWTSTMSRSTTPPPTATAIRRPWT